MGTLSDALPRASGRLQGLWETAKSRNLIIAAVVLPALLLLWPLAAAVVTLSLSDDRYFQVLVAPFLSCLLIYWHRAEIFANTQYSPRLGVPLLLASAVLCIALTYWQPQSGVTLRMAQSAAVLLLLSAFFLCHGPSSFRAALLPLGCLLVMIPLPPGWMDRVSAGYQSGSAEMSHALFKLTGIPVFREGMRFSLPGLDIEIAPECSGIRSSLMFFMLGILAASVYLQSGWRKLVVILATIPISILKNAVRIVSLSLLSIYVNRAFLLGPIHHQYGGVVSLPVDLLLFIPLLLALRRSEGHSSN